MNYNASTGSINIVTGEITTSKPIKLNVNCFWGHKWPKWSNPYTMDHVNGTVGYYQNRRCLKCNKEEIQRVI